MQAEEVLEEKWDMMTNICHHCSYIICSSLWSFYICCKLRCSRTDINMHLEKLVQSNLGNLKLV